MKKHSFLIILSLAIALFAAYHFSGKNSEATIQQDIAEKIIRFHVIANSDSTEDQNLKIKVKDAVLTYVSPLLSNSEDINETRSILTSNTDNIIAVAKNVIAENGYSYDVTANLTTDYFPTKTYGDVTFPPGDYEAYKIEIGDHEGKNWWCVMYPPLCFIDASHGVLPDSSKETLKNMLTEEEYESLTIDNTHFVFRFKYLTFLNKYLS
jgi:stage II sporulation protein R